MNASEILNLIAEMKAVALTPQDRTICDSMAVGIITQDIEPLKMAENLDYWLKLTKDLVPLRATDIPHHWYRNGSP